MSSIDEDEATISFPSIAIVAVLGFLIYRYFFSSSGDQTSGHSSSSSRNGIFFTGAHVDQVAQMFPQLSRRDIMWDLQRNRGNVGATIERVLTGRGLDTAPQSFQPPLPTTASTSASASSNTTTATNARPIKIHPDLITRYNLQAKVNSKGKEKEQSERTGWASSKEQRQTMLQRRRDEMILAARRKMQEKDAQILEPIPTTTTSSTTTSS